MGTRLGRPCEQEKKKKKKRHQQPKNSNIPIFFEQTDTLVVKSPKNSACLTRRFFLVREQPCPQATPRFYLAAMEIKSGSGLGTRLVKECMGFGNKTIGQYCAFHSQVLLVSNALWKGKTLVLQGQGKYYIRINDLAISLVLFTLGPKIQPTSPECFSLGGIHGQGTRHAYQANLHQKQSLGQFCFPKLVSPLKLLKVKVQD